MQKTKEVRKSGRGGQQDFKRKEVVTRKAREVDDSKEWKENGRNGRRQSGWKRKDVMTAK